MKVLNIVMLSLVAVPAWSANEFCKQFVERELQSGTSCPKNKTCPGGNYLRRVIDAPLSDQEERMIGKGGAVYSVIQKNVKKRKITVEKDVFNVEDVEVSRGVTVRTVSGGCRLQAVRLQLSPTAKPVEITDFNHCRQLDELNNEMGRLQNSIDQCNEKIAEQQKKLEDTNKDNDADANKEILNQKYYKNVFEKGEKGIEEVNKSILALRKTHNLDQLQSSFAPAEYCDIWKTLKDQYHAEKEAKVINNNSSPQVVPQSSQAGPAQ